jgi:cell wall-associated NlpC family hydrolase
MKFGRFVVLTVCCAFFAVSYASPTFAQDRARVIKTTSSRPINQPTTQSSTPAPVVKTLSSSKPVLTNEPVVQKPLIEKIGINSPVNATAALLAASHYSNSTSSLMLRAINSRLGIPYHYGSEGPNSYDCSGFVWSVFRDAGFSFDRSSAAAYWNEFEPVTGDDRFKFGTLVFFNGLGHVGIVADKDGFYQASSSKGITYSKFEGYWAKRITGFRRVPMAQLPQVLTTSAAATTEK